VDRYHFAGRYVVRGDNIAVVGEVDAERDAQIDFSKSAPHQPVGSVSLPSSWALF